MSYVLLDRLNTNNDHSFSVYSSSFHSNNSVTRFDTDAVLNEKSDESKKKVHEAISASRDILHIMDKYNKFDNYGTIIVPREDYKASVVIVPRVYSRRWLNLILFCLYSFSNSFQWIHLNIISDSLSTYYNQSLPNDTFQRNSTIDWLSMVYMLAYIPLILPASWILNKMGLRFCCICGSMLNAAGAWLKCASVSPDRFALLMFAQTICAMGQVWVLGIPARLAAIWFGPNEVSTATSLGVFGNQVGIAVGFLIPPIIIDDSNNMEATGSGLTIICFSTAAFTTCIFILICIFSLTSLYSHQAEHNILP
uniref:Major facilitator superfamily (MFS) profile domain-containing protein n=1 Tax=Arion vulgaris TaxID=1028688 RepID=A0A0B7A656_9EUPU